MSTSIENNVQAQPWTNAFADRSEKAFEIALAVDVQLEASALIKPVVGREEVKIVMAGASAGYEHLVFTDQVKSGNKTWLEWEARTYSGLQLWGVTVLRANDKGEIENIRIHHRPLQGLLKFSAELGDRIADKVDRSHFYAG